MSASLVTVSGWSHAHLPRGWTRRFARITSPSANVSVPNSIPHEVRIHYVDVPAYTSRVQKQESDIPPSKGTCLLIHGFPETWYSWRHIMVPLSDAGYRLIVPDYRGAGNSQAPPHNAGFAGGKGGGYTKIVMADDLHTVVYNELGITEKIHVIGHDIGAMVAHAYCNAFPEHCKSLVWNDAPIPGSTFWEEFKKLPVVWHFHFHNVQDDLPERLVQDRERIYLRNFYDRLNVRVDGVPPGSDAEDAYVLAYSRPGALRAAFDTYRCYAEDAKENQSILRSKGKCPVPAFGICGDMGPAAEIAAVQLSELYETVLDTHTIKDCGHFTPEEAPEEFLEKVIGWIGSV